MASPPGPRCLYKVAVSTLLGAAILLGAGTTKDGLVNAEGGKEQDENFQALRAWVEEHGGEIHPNVVVSPKTPTGPRGVLAVGPISSGQVLWSIPKNISYTDAEARKSLGAFLIDVVENVDKVENVSSTVIFSKYHWYLALGLAVETKIKGKDSFYWPWFSLLPERCPNLFCLGTIEELLKVPETLGLKNVAAKMQWDMAIENSESVVRLANFISSEAKRIFAHIQTEQGKEDKEKYDSKPDYKLIEHLTIDHILWGLGIASSRDFKSSASDEAVEKGAPSLITLPYADMPNHAAHSQTFMNIRSGDSKDDDEEDADPKSSEEVCSEKSKNITSAITDNVQFVLESRREYQAGDEITISYHSTQLGDWSWLVYYGGIPVNNTQAEYTLNVVLDPSSYPRYVNVSDAAFEAGTVRDAKERDHRVLEESMNRDRGFSPSFWGTARAMTAASRLNFSDVVESESNWKTNLFKKATLPEVLNGSVPCGHRSLESATIEKVADWINQIYEFESRGLKSTDFWEKADAAWSQGKDAEALLLTLHGNGLSVLEYHISYLKRLKAIHQSTTLGSLLSITRFKKPSDLTPQAKAGSADT